MKKRKIIDEQKVLELYSNGFMLKEITEYFNTYEDKIRKILSKHNIIPSIDYLNKRKQACFNSSNLVQITMLYSNGLPLEEIGKLLGIHPQTVKKIIKENNIRPSKKMRTKRIYDLKNIIINEFSNNKLSVKSIAGKYKVSCSTIFGILKEYNVLTHKIYNYSDVESILQKYGSINMVYKLTGIPSKHIKNYIIDNNISYKKKMIRYNEICNETKFIAINWYLNGVLKKTIINDLGITASQLKLILKNENIELRGNLRIPKCEIPNLLKYTRSARKLSFRIRELNGLVNKGKDGLDWNHRYTILDGYKNKIPIEIISSLANQELIPKSENRKQGFTSKITINELIKDIINLIPNLDTSIIYPQ